MEWTGRQQLYFLLQSVGVGVIQGLILDTLSTLEQLKRRRRFRLTDVLFGPIAAIVTFCGALVIMDGQLHPVLFFGVAVGMLLEHVTIGIWLCRCMRRIRIWWCKGLCLCARFLKKSVSFLSKNTCKIVKMEKTS